MKLGNNDNWIEKLTPGIRDEFYALNYVLTWGFSDNEKRDTKRLNKLRRLYNPLYATKPPISKGEQ